MVTGMKGESAPAPESERQKLVKMETLLRNRKKSSSKITVRASGEQVEVPERAIPLIRELVSRLARGQEVSIVSPPKLLTTQEAADLLHVSRPYMVRLLEQGKIPYTKTGTHRRIRYEDLNAFRDQFDTKRQSALNRLTAMSQELGLYSD